MEPRDSQGRRESDADAMGVCFCGRSGRKPTTDELAAARALVGEKPNADGVADLLWAVVCYRSFSW